MKSAITSKTGRTISFVRLNQVLTYAGLLEGLPTRERNQMFVQETIDAARRRRQAVYLVPPHETPIEQSGDPYPFGTPAALPAIRCLAELRSPNGPCAVSLLTILWFQEEYAFPIDAAVKAHIEDLDWDAFARCEEL